MNVNHPFLFIIRADYLPLGHDILFISKVESLNNCSNSNQIKNVINSTNIPGTKLNISQIVKKKPININQIKQSSKETNKKGNETNNKKIIVHPSSATSNKNKNIKGDIKVSTNITPAGKIQINKNIKISKESILNKSRPVSSKMYK